MEDTFVYGGVVNKSEKQKNYKGKGKAVPLQAWAGSEGSRRLGIPDFKTVGT